MFKSLNIGDSPQPPNPQTRHPSFVTILLIFLFSIFYLSACGVDVEDSTPPSKPQWVPKSLPEEWPERGIDAHESGGIFLEWEPNPIEENVTSYLLYRAKFFDVKDSLGNFELLATLMVESSSGAEYIDRNVTKNTRYHYLLLSEDGSGNQSSPSDTLDYRRFIAISSASMLPNDSSVALATDRKLRWSYTISVAMENYTMTIINTDNELILRQELTPGTYIGNTEYFIVPDTLVLTPGNIYKWRVDMGGRYVDGRETVGSESEWATFLYSGP